ncbi:tape measure protein [Rheinheimera pleomorphica]|uniref:tape measure protein n=1 Tax=Rheinheimera pleomorphica TaxID=2703963 RepID=UPI001422AFB0|nr:tape measure protein [Rheinheimera pleomorphica]
MSKNLELALKIAATVTGDKDLARMADAVRDVGKGAAEADPKADELASSLDKLSNQQKLIQELQATKREFAAQEIATAAVASKLEALKKETNDTGKPFVELAKNVDKAEQQLSEMRKELDATASNQNRLQAELKETGIDTRQLGAEKKRLQTDLKKTAAEAQKLGKEYLAANGRQGAFGAGVASVTGRLVALAGTYLGLNQLVTTIKSIFNTGSQFEKLGVQFNALMGSLEGGQQATAWVKEFAKDTPLQLEEVSKAFVRLKAFGIDPMDGTLQAITDQAFKLGGGFQEVEGISLALGQAWAKQKLQGEEILQLVERGVPVWDLLAKVTGKNTAELQKMSEQGKIGRDVIKQLIDEMGSGAQGAAAANMSLLSGLISNAKDNLAQFYNLIATSGSMDWLKGQLEDLNRNFEQMAADGTLQQWAKDISDTIVSIGEGIKTTAKTLYDFKEVIGVVAAAWATLKVGSFFLNLIDGSRKAGVALLSLVGIQKTVDAANASNALSIADLTGKIRGGITATGNWVKSLTGLGGLLAKGGIFAGVAYGVFQIGSLAKALWDYKDAVDELKVSKDGLADQEARWTAEIERINIALGTNYQTRKEVLQAVDDGILSYNAEAQAYQLATNAVKQKTEALIGHGYQLESNTGKISELEEAYKTLGIVSTKSLQDSAEQSRIAYETIAAGNEPIEQQRAAFLKYAEAAAKAAAASGESVPNYVAEQAAALGLKTELDKLTGQKAKAADVTKLQADAYGNMRNDLSKTQQSIQEYKDVLDSSTASSEEKQAAAEALAKAETKLTAHTTALNEVKQLELATFAQLQQKYEEYTRQMEQLDELYRTNGISAAEYLRQKDRYVQVLNIIKPMLAGLKDGEQELQQQTDFSNKSLAEQQSILEGLSGTTGKAVQYISLLAQAQQALSTEFNLTDKSTNELSARVKELNGFIAQNNRVTNIWWTDLARASNAAFTRERQIITETMLIRKYTEQLNSSSVSLRDVARISQAMKLQFRELGESELAPLRNAISDAERRIMSLRDGLQGTFRSLQDELDRLQDNQAAIEKRNYDAQLAELNSKLKEAQTAGDKEAVNAARQSLALAKEIYAIKQAQLKEEQATRQPVSNNDPVTNAPTPRQQTRQPIQTTQPATTGTSVTSGSNTVRLELVLPGRSFNASMARTDAASLLAEIERAASTSI